VVGEVVGTDVVGANVGEIVGGSVQPTQVNKQLAKKPGLVAHNPRACPLLQKLASRTS
jgi:hypothetical protein